MSVSIANLFNYSRALPEPFDSLTSKKVKVASKYASGTEATLCLFGDQSCSCVLSLRNHGGEGAVGWVENKKCVAEYKSSMGPDLYHLVVIDVASGSALASVYDKNTETAEQYVAHASKRDGAALFFCLMPVADVGR